MTYKLIDIQSSYKENDLGQTLYNEVIKHKPNKIIDFGILYGYSTVAFAQACKDLNKGIVYAYDIFSDYKYNHSVKQIVETNIHNYNVEAYVKIKHIDFYEWLKTDEDFDMLHLDISNDGDIINTIYNRFKDTNKIIIFEGGTRARDDVPWMVEHKKTPIRNHLAKYNIIDTRFPSISRLNLK